MTATIPGTRATEAWQLADMEKLLQASIDAVAPEPVTVSVLALGLRDERCSDRAAAPARFPTATRPRITVYVYGQLAVAGPLPAASGQPARPAVPCERCLAGHWHLVRPKALREALEAGGRSTMAASVAYPAPYLTPFAIDALATLISAALAPARTSDERYPPVFVCNLADGLAYTLPLLPDPECRQCGQRAEDAPTVIELGPAAKPTPDTFRPRPVDDIPIPERALVNPVCGMLGVAAEADIGSLTTAAVHGSFHVSTNATPYRVGWGGHNYSYRTSTRTGLLEGLERYAGMRPRNRLIRHRETLRSLRARGERALDPRECGVYSDEFYASIPFITPFSDDLEISWTWGYSLRDEAPVLVPELLAFHHSAPETFLQECSNGCASGSSLTEATYFGLMELIERDAFVISWYGQAALPEIDPQSSRDPITRQMVDRLAMYGYQARFFDARITFPVPVIVGVAVRADGGMGALCFGAGASLNPEDALRSGLIEVATDALPLRRRTLYRLDEFRAMAADFNKVMKLHDHPLMYGLPEMAKYASFLLDNAGPRLSLEETYARPPVPLRPALDLRDDLQHCVEAVTGRGFDVIVVDQTFGLQRELGVHTVSVIVPGLVPIDFGWRRQRALLAPRTRTALREAGLRDRDLTPADLNPAPHPFP